MTLDEAALERVFEEVSEGLAQGLLLYGQGYLVVERAWKQGMSETRTEALRFLTRTEKEEKAWLQAQRLQKERRANQQHFRHHGAKR